MLPFPPPPRFPFPAAPPPGEDASDPDEGEEVETEEGVEGPVDVSTGDTPLVLRAWRGGGGLGWEGSVVVAREGRGWEEGGVEEGGGLYLTWKGMKGWPRPVGAGSRGVERTRGGTSEGGGTPLEPEAPEGRGWEEAMEGVTPRAAWGPLRL